MKFYDEIQLDHEIGSWYLDQANFEEVNVFEFFEMVLTNYYYRMGGNEDEI